MNFKLTLRIKLLSLTIILLASLSISLSIYLETYFSQVLSNELLKRGASISRHVAEVCTEAFIEHDYLKLEDLARKHKSAEADIVYILMLNQNNEVIAHSFSQGYPLDLIKIKHTINGEKTSIQRLDFGGVPLYDIAAPVMDARIGSVRIGISAEPLHQAVDTMVGQILGIIILLSLIALIIAYPVLQKIIRPILLLTHAVEQLTQGKRAQQLPVTSNDELGLLTNAFNHMAGTIQSSEKKLAAHADFLQILIDDIPLPVFYKNRQGVMLGCNHAYTNFWGKPKQDIVGHQTKDIYSPSDVELHRRKDQEVIDCQASLHYEHSAIDAKGQTRHIIFIKAPFCNEAGDLAGVIGVMQDITEQRQADQMKSEFVSTVAHEFQTPLATIIGFVELIQEQRLNPKEHAEALEVIARKTESLSEMVDELLDLARIETGAGLTINLEQCNVNEAMTELIRNFSKRTMSHHFSLKLPEKDVIIPADKTRMGQVMENLLSNAVKYSDKQSTIDVSVTSSETYCQVQVSDQGIGLTEKQAGQIFEKYYRVDNSNTSPAGTGLGLFITKSIIDAHKGEIEVSSILGRGTIVTFKIPKRTA